MGAQLQSLGGGFFRLGQRVNSYPGDRGVGVPTEGKEKHKLGPKRKKILEHSIWSIMDTLILVRRMNKWMDDCE